MMLAGSSRATGEGQNGKRSVLPSAPNQCVSGRCKVSLLSTTGARFTSYILPALTLWVRRGIYSSKRSGVSRDCLRLLGPSEAFMGEIKAHETFTVNKIQRRENTVCILHFHKKTHTYVAFFVCLFVLNSDGFTSPQKSIARLYCDGKRRCDSSGSSSI